MEFTDDRTEAQQRTHHVVIMMTDTFLSGWGKAEDGPSFAGWACQPSDADKVEQWVRSRSDSSRVREVGSGYRPPAGQGHCHIYVCGNNHSALKV